MISFRTNERGFVPRPVIEQALATLATSKVEALPQRNADKRFPVPRIPQAKPCVADPERVRYVLRAVAMDFAVTVEDIRSPSRADKIVLPRHVAAFLLKVAVGVSYPRVARAIGRVDHSTAIHAHQRIDRLMGEDRTLALRVVRLAEVVRPLQQSAAA